MPSGPGSSVWSEVGDGPAPWENATRIMMKRLLYQDEARLEYGRRFWRDPVKRDRLLRHWLDVRHPYSDRLRERWLPLVDRVLRSPPGSDDALDAALQAEGSSLRAVVREIPPVFGTFFTDSEHACCHGSDAHGRPAARHEDAAHPSSTRSKS
jgi:hypothetical protein